MTVFEISDNKGIKDVIVIQGFKVAMPLVELYDLSELLDFKAMIFLVEMHCLFAKNFKYRRLCLK